MKSYKEFNYLQYQYTSPLYHQKSQEKKNKKTKEYSGYETWKPCVIHQEKTCRHITAKEVLRKANKRSVFFSQYRFSEDTETFKPKDNKAHVALKWGNLIMESDKGDVIEYSRIMFNYLTVELNIPAEYISLAYSGSRSIHVEIDGLVWGYEPSVDLPELQKHIVRILAERAGTIDKWDTGIYYPKRVFRAMNSHRADKGTWKIPINPDELFNLSMEDLKILASQGPRKDFPLINVIGEPIEKARQIMLEARQKLSDSLRTEKVIRETKPFPNINVDRLCMNGQPPCIQYLIEKGTTEGLRNISSIFHGTFCKDSGMAIEDAEEEISIWHTRIPSKHSQKERERQLKDVLNTIYSASHYNFYCKNLADIIYLPCSNKCHIYPKKQNVIEIPANEKPTTVTLSISEAREQMAITIRKCLEQAGSDLIQATPGTGKTHITLKTATEMSNNTGKRFIYINGLKEQLEELRESGYLPEANWTIIYARAQIKDSYSNGERAGNCYHADKIKRLIDDLRHPANKVIKTVCRDCKYRNMCKTNSDMYIGQWHTGKNLAMTHTMYVLAVEPRKDELGHIHKVIIDEDIHKETFKAVEISPKYISPIDKHPLIKSIASIMTNLLERGENDYITGANLISLLEHHANMPVEALLSIPIKDMLNEFHWKEDFIKVLQEEYKYMTEHGENYMSRIHLRYYKKHHNIEFYFYIRRRLPDYDTLALDATTHSIVWEKVLGRKIVTHNFHVTQPLGMEVIQIKDGKYGKNAHYNSKLLEREKQITSILKSKANQDVFVAGWKGTNEDISRYFYNLRGTNEFEDLNIAVILGTCNIRPNTLKEITASIFYDEQPVSFETSYELVQYGMNIEGKDYANKTLKAIDPRYCAIWSIYREAELFQAINRIRPFNKESTRIYLITSLPIPWIVPTELVTMKELIGHLKRLDNINICGDREQGKIVDLVQSTLWYYAKWISIIDHVLWRATDAVVARDNEVNKSANRNTDNALPISDFVDINIYNNVYNIADLFTALTGSTQGKDVRHEILSHSKWSNMSDRKKRYMFSHFVKMYNLKKKQYKCNRFKGNKLTLYYNGDYAPSLGDVVKDYISFCEGNRLNDNIYL